jgi:hypothetical protein
MTKAIRAGSFVFLLAAIFSAEAHAQTCTGASCTAASCNTSDVQNAINAASEGYNVVIPAGTCSWTSGVTVSGKGLNINGAGSGRIIAYDAGTTAYVPATGTQTFTIAGFSPGFSASSITTGMTLTAFASDYLSNSMTGTVTSYNSSTGALVMNITSTTGTGSCPVYSQTACVRWFFATQPSTVIINNSSNPLFAITEDTSVHTNWSGIKIQSAGATGTGTGIALGYTSGGQAVLIHDCFFDQGAWEGIDSTTNRGVIWNCSFAADTNNAGTLSENAAVRIKGCCGSSSIAVISWTTPSTWGSADTTGQGALYVETNDFHAYGITSDNDDGGRMVWRYNLLDNSQLGTHGADTSGYGQRYFEIYNNIGVYNAYANQPPAVPNYFMTFNINGWLALVRGGSYVFHDNNLPQITGGGYGTKPDIAMTVMNLQRNAGPNPCWGAGFTTPGQYYHAPRQVGMGYVTGTGTANYCYTGEACVNGSTDAFTYVGDSEPAYIWNNNRSMNVSIQDYGLGNSGTGANSCPSSPTPDSSVYYIEPGRDFFNGTAKPGYTPYTYPHPLTDAGTAPAPPTNLTATAR